MRLTSREKQIIEILKKEPLISQEEMARRLGIARSSAAVHISNLIKKGVILGRGYVFNERVSGVVLGRSGIEIDVAIRSHKGREADAKIETRYSGSAFKAATCLARFGMDVKLLTVVGTDEEGDRLVELLKKQRVDITNIYRHPQGRTMKMVRLFNGPEVVEYRDDVGASFFQQLLEAWEWLLLNCEWLVVEPDYHEIVLKRLSSREQEKRPLLSTFYRARDGLPEYLREFYLVVLGVPGENDIETWAREGLVLVENGLENLVVTDGVTRVHMVTSDGMVEIPLPPNQGFDVSEGLEAFLAGMVYGLSQGYQFRQAVRIGSGTASLAGVSSA